MRVLLFATALAILVGGAAVADDDTKLRVKEGDPAPQVTLPATQIDKVLPEQKDAQALALQEFKGKKNVVLFFFPKAMTKGCTVECRGFRDHLDQFAKLDTVLIGISTDPLDAQKKFTEKDGLNFPLFADADQKASKAFGVMMPGKPLSQRVTFVIDKQGTIRKIYPKVNPEKHPAEVLEFVKAGLSGK